MIENKKNKIMQKPEIRFIVFSGEDVITTSGPYSLKRTHTVNNEKASFGLGGFFDSENWYTGGHQN